jgi:hypothetical protein
MAELLFSFGGRWGVPVRNEDKGMDEFFVNVTLLCDPQIPLSSSSTKP